MKWIKGSEHIWSCPHVNKCQVLLEYRDRKMIESMDELIVYNTDWPEPSGNYRYIFLNELDYQRDGRNRIKCDCKK